MTNLEYYIKIDAALDKRVQDGENSLSHELRAMCRQLYKLYKRMTKEERLIADQIDGIAFR